MKTTVKQTSAVAIVSEINALKGAWGQLQSEAAALGINTVNFALRYSRLYSKIRDGKEDRLADDAVKSLNAAVGIDDSKASMFRRIAERADMFVQHKAQLPPSLDAMYQIAQLPQSQAVKLFDKGKIHPGLTAREARVLNASSPARSQQTSKKTAPPSASIRLTWSNRDHTKMVEAVRRLLTSCSSAQIRVTDRKLRDDLDEAIGPTLRDRLEK